MKMSQIYLFHLADHKFGRADTTHAIHVCKMEQPFIHAATILIDVLPWNKSSYLVFCVELLHVDYCWVWHSGCLEWGDSHLWCKSLASQHLGPEISMIFVRFAVFCLLQHMTCLLTPQYHCELELWVLPASNAIKYDITSWSPGSNQKCWDQYQRGM